MGQGLRADVEFVRKVINDHPESSGRRNCRFDTSLHASVLVADENFQS
jgi:hypothetical protein